jgi:hypothetical protein
MLNYVIIIARKIITHKIAMFVLLATSSNLRKILSPIKKISTQVNSLEVANFLLRELDNFNNLIGTRVFIGLMSSEEYRKSLYNYLVCRISL